MSVAEALTRACDHDLPDVFHESYQGRVSQHRPTPENCDVYLFQETWGSTAMGRAGIAGAAMTTGDTVVVIMNDCACVYRNGRLDYKAIYDNAFLEGLRAFALPGKTDFAKSNLTRWREENDD